jgi:hypothetical protein
MLRVSLAALAVASLTVTAAMAQTASDPASPDMSPAAQPDAAQPDKAPMAPAPTGEPRNAAATERTTADGRPVMLLPTPNDANYAKSPDSPSVTSNGPVPDTRANRARFGGPDSKTGRRTAPHGN